MAFYRSSAGIERFSHDEEALVDNCGADYEQAEKDSYLDFMSFSRDGLIRQLEYEGLRNRSGRSMPSTNLDIDNKKTGSPLPSENRFRLFFDIPYFIAETAPVTKL